MIVGVIKPQLCMGNIALSAVYGEILHRAWKEIINDSCTVLGNVGDNSYIVDIIQQFAHDAIHAADKKYFRSLRAMLNVIHQYKRMKGVDDMLYRVYSPIIWRSLRCANSIIREQSTMLFLDIFPLQSSTITSNVDEQQLLQKQFDMMSILLKDSDHKVRSAAAFGICKVLSSYWDLIPPQITRQVLAYIVGTLGTDSSCAEVRCAVISGLSELLENPLSHTVLKGLLNVISNAIHDNSDKVKIAFIKLLNKVFSINQLINN